MELGRLAIAIAVPTVLALSGTALHMEARAATLIVDAHGGTPYPTIQSAINAAVPVTDDVFVRCGIYLENISMVNGVTVRGQDPQCTIIDGGASSSVVTMLAIGSTTILEGFTIRNGQSSFGGGIYIEGGSPRIARNVITGNSAVAPGGSGGGIFVASEPPPGEDLVVTKPVITRNVIRGNQADVAGGGIEVFPDAGPTISNNLIVGNTAVQYGGGIDAYFSYPTIVNNTIVRNCIQGSGTACALGGGAISLANSGIVPIENNVIAWNEAAAGGGGVDLASSTATFSSNDAFMNQPQNYSGVADPTFTNGNISLDPLFVDEQNTFPGYQPRSDSPLIDTGSASLAPANDLRGIPRPVDGDANGTAQVDIGARENEGITRLKFNTKDVLVWDPSVAAPSTPSLRYNLYRGNMQTLRTSGVYTQDPGGTGSGRQCALSSATATDLLPRPVQGQTFFYLVVIRNTVEGTLGFRSDLSGVSERPYSSTPGFRCP